MKLYEIDRKIDELLEKGFTEDCVDMETGEILVDKAVSLLDALKMEQEKKLEGIACYIKNLAADSKKIREEEKNLAERRKSLENRQKRLSDFLSAYLQDRAIYRFDSARCKISFRKSEAVEIYDEAVFMQFAQEKTDLELLRCKQPEPDKTQLSKLLKIGVEVPGTGLVEHVNMQIK